MKPEYTPSAAAIAKVERSRAMVASLLAERGETLAPDDDFTTVTALARHYRMGLWPFIALLDKSGIRRKADGSPSDAALKADAARLKHLTPSDDPLPEGVDTYWRWNRDKTHTLLVATGAMKLINANRRKHALRMFNPYTNVQPGPVPQEMLELVALVDADGKSLLAQLRKTEAEDREIGVVAERLRKNAARLERQIRKRGGAGGQEISSTETWTSCRLRLAKEIIATIDAALLGDSPPPPQAAGNS